MTTVRINYFQNSRQIQASSIDCFFDNEDFESIKRTTRKFLESFPLGHRGNVNWASFEILQPDGSYFETTEMYKERIRIS